MKQLKYILFIFMSLAIMTPAISQTITEQAAKEELARRGLADQEDRIKQELQNRGIDINNVDTSNPAEVKRVQDALDEIIKEIENEKKDQLQSGDTQVQQKNNEPTSINNIDAVNAKIEDTNVIEAVKDGATVEEAIADEVREIEEKKLPDAITYGQHIFRSQNVQFYKKSSDAKAPSSYKLGPGDKVAISIWGLSVYNQAFTISNEGSISPFPEMRIYLSGISLVDAEKLIKSRMANRVRFRTDDFEVSVLAARTINVNISGEVFNYGNFNISALNNAFNALVASGGPTDIGSVRKIQLRRSGESAKTLDIYKYLQDPLVGDEYYLQENDYIFVPVAEKIVTITGAVNRPFKYELLPNEKLSDLINFAGGLKNNALSRNLQIQRRINDDLEIIDVNYDQAIGKSTQLKDGDVITVSAVDSKLEKIVTVEGAVELPGSFAYTDDLKIVDIINKAQLKENAITDVVYITRVNPDLVTSRYEIINLTEAISNPNGPNNILLQKGDKINIKSLASFADKRIFTVTGSVRSEGEYEYATEGTLKVSDAIFLSGGLTDDALLEYAYIYRKISPNSPELQYVVVNLREALLSPGSDSDILIKPNDRLVISNRNQFKQDFYIQVMGEVAEPKEIQYDPSLSLQSALRLAGGLRLESNPDRVNIYRVDFTDINKTKVLAANLKINSDLSIVGGDEFQLQPFDQIIIRRAPDFELLRNVKIEGEVKYPGTYVLTKENTRVLDIIKDAGGLTDEAFVKGVKLYRKQDDIGYVIFDLDEAIKNERSFNNIILQKGDEITLPKISNLVSVTGATKADQLYTDDIASSGIQTFPFEQGKNAKYYIDKYAGGVNELADKSRITVEYSNGEVKQTKRFLFFRNYPEVKPGSRIRVGYKDVEVLTPEQKENEKIDWGAVLRDSITQATTVLSFILLLQSVD